MIGNMEKMRFMHILGIMKPEQQRMNYGITFNFVIPFLLDFFQNEINNIWLMCGTLFTFSRNYSFFQDFRLFFPCFLFPFLHSNHSAHLFLLFVFGQVNFSFFFLHSFFVLCSFLILHFFGSTTSFFPMIFGSWIQLSIA